MRIRRTQPSSRSAAPIARRVLRLFGAHRRSIALLNLAVLVSALLGLGIPVITKLVFDRALFPAGGHPRLGLLAGLVGGMIAFGLLGGVASIWQTYVANSVGQAVMHDLRDQLYSHLQGMSLRFFASTRTGEIQSRIANDIGGVSSVVTDTFTTFAADAAIALTALAAMAVLSWQLTLLSLVLLPGFVLLAGRVGRARRELAGQIQTLLAEMSVAAEETLSVSGALLAKISDRGDDATQRYRAQSRELARLRVREQMIGRTFIGMTGMFLMIAPALVYLVAGLAISGGDSRGMTAGTIVAFLALQSRLYGPVKDMLNMSLELQASLALFERVFEYLDLTHEVVDHPGARALDRVRGAVALRDVHFSYEPAAGRDAERAAWALAGVSLEVGAGAACRPRRTQRGRQDDDLISHPAVV